MWKFWNHFVHTSYEWETEPMLTLLLGARQFASVAEERYKCGIWEGGKEYCGIILELDI